MALKLWTDAFTEGGPIPRKHAREGEDLAPPVQWKNAPEGTQSFAMIMEDPDAPDGAFTHWIRYDLPADSEGMPEGDADVGKQGRNDFQIVGYGGPHPPPRHGEHRYFFRLYALDVDSVGLEEGANAQQVQAAIEPHVLDQAEIYGVYERR